MNIETMTVMQIAQVLIDKHKEHERAIRDYADAKILYDSLEESKKYIFSKNLPDEGPEWRAKKAAETSPEYKQLKEAIDEARSLYTKKWAELEPIKMKIESLRTVISYLKQEVRQLGG